MSKKKILLIGIGVVILVSILSTLGGGEEQTAETPQKEVVLKADQTEIKGDLKGCYEVVDKNYKVKFAKKSYERDVVNVELKRTSKALPYDRKDVVVFPEAGESAAKNCAGFGIEILDADGNVVDKINAKATPYSWDEVTAVLQLLPDETATIGFRFDDLSEAVSFRITSIVEKNEKRKTSVSSEVDALMDVAKEAAKLSKDVDVKKAQSDAEDALKVAGQAMKTAGKMLEALEELEDMDDLDDLDDIW